MWRELIAAGRRLRSDRWATASAAVAIALGTGLASAVFAIAYGVLLRPLPYRDASRLVMLDASAPLGQIDEWRQRLPALAPLAACARSPLTVRGMGDPRPVPAAVVDDAFFEVLGVPPVEGRVFGALHETGVAVVSERFARDAGAPAGAILGHTIRIGSAPLTVVGVMGDRFAFPSDATDVWIPARAVPAVPLGASADERRFQLFGHLRAGATLAEVRAEAARALTAIDPRARPFPGGGADLLRDRITAPVRPALFACGAAAALVLLVACANVATILIGRTIARVRELAIRRAIGASRGQIFATTVAEAVLIACAGGAAGAALAALAVRATVAFGAAGVPRLTDVRADWVLVLFAAGIAALSSIASALPALRASDPAVLSLRGTHGESRRGTRLRSLLTASQIAIAVMLLTAGALLSRTIATLLDRDIGIDPRGTLVSQLALSDVMSFNARGRAVSLHAVLDRVRAMPGVIDAGAGTSLPPNNGSLAMTFRVVSGTSDTTTPELTFAAVTPGFLDAIGARLVRGRLFDAADVQRGDFLVVLSASAARLLSPGKDPAGTALPLSLPGLHQRGHPTVAGIIGDIKYEGLEFNPGPAVYVLWKEVPASQLFLAVRSEGDPRALAPALRAAIRDADPATPVMPIRPMAEVMRRSIADRRARALLGGIVAVLAFAMALAGLAGALGRMVVERRRELAIRAALGATPARTMRLVLGDAAIVVGGGIAAGTAGALAGAGVLRSVLYGVGPRDATTLAAVAGTVALVSLALCAVPARRAAASDPMDVLRDV